MGTANREWIILLPGVVGACLGVLGADIATEVREASFTELCAKAAPPGNTGYATQYKGHRACLFVPYGADTWTVKEEQVK